MLRGSRSHELPPVLPADAARKTPELIMLVSAVRSGPSAGQFQEALATAGLIAFLVTHSTAAIAEADVPLPAQSSHFTPCNRTLFATPYVVDPIVPATWVPWPMQSVLLESIPLKSKLARPPKSGCEGVIPVSMMYACTP